MLLVLVNIEVIIKNDEDGEKEKIQGVISIMKEIGVRKQEKGMMMIWKMEMEMKMGKKQVDLMEESEP